MASNMPKIVEKLVYSKNAIMLFLLTFSLLSTSSEVFGQLNSKGNPPEEILHALSIKHPEVKATNWSWNKKYVEYIGYFEENNKINEVHINVYGKWTKTITYLEKQHLSDNIISTFEAITEDNVTVSEVFKEKSKDWGVQYKIRYLNNIPNKPVQEIELTFSEEGHILKETSFKKQHVPFVVSKEFKETYENSKKEKWVFNQELFAFEVNFKANNRKNTAYYSPNGEWMWSEIDATLEEVPEEVITSIENTDLKDWKLDDIFELSTNQLVKCYKVQLKNQNKKEYLFFSVDGHLIDSPKPQ